MDRVNDFLDTLDPADEQEASRGVAVIVGTILRLVREELRLGQTAGNADRREPGGEGDPRSAAAIDGTPGGGVPEGPPPAVPPLAVEEAPPGVLVVDRATFTVSWNGKTCDLGHTKGFLLIESLNRKVGRFVPLNDLKDQVWDGDDPEPNTVQKTVSNLRKKLEAAGIVGPVIRAERGHYMLKLT